MVTVQVMSRHVTSDATCGDAGTGRDSREEVTMTRLMTQNNRFCHATYSNHCDHARQFTSTPAPHRSMLPLYWCMNGAFQPPKARNPSKLGW